MNVRDTKESWLRLNYPNIYKSFVENQQEALELFAKKHSDYGRGNIESGFGETFDLLALSIRMRDKIMRLLNILYNERETVNESLEDSFIDLMNYANIALILIKKEWDK